MIHSLRSLKRKQDRARIHGCVLCCTYPDNQPKEAVPEIDKEYYCYDDGKIRITREYTVVISELISYKRLPRNIKRLWQQEVIGAYWLYATESDYFVKAIDPKRHNEHWFCRTKDGGWFGFGRLFDCGRLDTTGDLYKIAHDGERRQS